MYLIMVGRISVPRSFTPDVSHVNVFPYMARETLPMTFRLLVSCS